MLPLAQQAGPLLVINSEQEVGKRLEFYPGQSQSTGGSQDLWPIGGISGQWPLEFLEPQQRTRLVASCKPHGQLLSSTSSPTRPQAPT